MTTQHQPTGPIDEINMLARLIAEGRFSRRMLIRRAVALGFSASAITAILAACGTEAPSPTVSSGGASAAPATSAAPAATTAASAAPAGSAPARSTPASSAPASAAASSAAPGKRGGGGVLKLIQWQAPTILNPHLSSGTKDSLACSPVYESLLTFDIDAKAVPVLAAEVPTKENGQLAADGKSVTIKLKQGVKWSDGQAFTADDVIFTFEYVSDPKTAATSVSSFDGVDKIEKVDETTVRYTFKEPNPAWFRPAQANVIPRHVFEKDRGEGARTSPNNLKPIGTGPYKVTDFKPGDAVSYALNENYREANKPFFDTIELKGGGDAASAGRAVLQSGEYDYAWNLQLDDAVLKQLETGGKGVAEFGPGGGVERIIFNFADPNKEVDGERANPKTPHPFLTDQKVRQAFVLASDRNSIVQSLYGRGGSVDPNILVDPPQFRSSNTKAEFSLEKAAAQLEEAGWKKSGQYREKGGVALSVVFQTSINTLRQKTQLIIKDGWEKSGIKTELKSVDSAVFFSSDPGNPDTNSHFYADVEMFTGTPVIDPQTDMTRWHSKYIASKANSWSGRNYQRYNNPEYDKLWDQAKAELDANKRAQLFIQMNDILINGAVVLPLVNRKSVYGHAKNLQGLKYTPWDGDYWNIADWTRS